MRPSAFGKLVLIAGLFGSLVSLQAANVLIDDFGDPIGDSVSVIEIQVPPGSGTNTAVRTGLTVPSGPTSNNRTSTIVLNTGNGPANALTLPGTLVLSVPTSTEAELTVSYTFDPFDATSSGLNDTIEIGIDESDADLDDSMTISFTGGGNMASQPITLSVGGSPVKNTPVQIPMSSFAGVDFTDLTGMELLVTGDKLDFGINSVAAIPEPSAASMLLLGSVSLLARRRRSRD